MNRASYQELWRERWQKNARVDAYAQVLAMDPFKDWQLNVAPQKAAADEFSTALEILYAGESARLAEQFLDRAQAILARIHQEQALDQPRRQMLPSGLQHAQLFRLEAFVNAFRSQTGFDRQLLTTAAQHYKAYGESVEQRDWHEMTQYEFLTGVHLCLIDGDLELAARLMQTRRKFGGQKRHHALLQKLISCCSRSDAPAGDLLAEFEVLFDIVRAPPWVYRGRQPEFYFPSDIAGFEWALMLERIRARWHKIPNWPEVIASACA